MVTSVAISTAFFLAWDDLFVKLGVWGFNEQYLVGIYLGSLPLEEFAFFFTTPVTLLFLYEAFSQRVKHHLFDDIHVPVSWFFFLCTVFLGVYFYPKLYTSVCFFLAALFLGLQLFVLKSRWLGRFYLAFFAALLPFFTLNLWLTGTFTPEPLVWHDNIETMGLKIFSMPVEDIVYLLVYLLITIMVYERSKRSWTNTRVEQYAASIV